MTEFAGECSFPPLRKEASSVGYYRDPQWAKGHKINAHGEFNPKRDTYNTTSMLKPQETSQRRDRKTEKARGPGRLLQDGIFWT